MPTKVGIQGETAQSFRAALDPDFRRGDKGVWAAAYALIVGAGKEAVMNDALGTFLDSLDAEQPPSNASALLRAVWYGLCDNWKQAHEIAQKDDTADGAWVHAWLHRIEGDNANAGYWYRRAGRPVATGNTRHEGETIAAALLSR